MVMVMELVLTALAAVLLSFLVAKLVSAVVGGGEEREVVEEGGGVVVGGERRRSGSGKRVRFVDEKERLVVDRSEGVEERCVSEMAVVGEGFGDVAESVGGDVVVESAVEGDGKERGEVSGSTEMWLEKSLQSDCGGGAVGVDESVGSVVGASQRMEMLEVEEIGGVVEENGAGSGNAPLIDDPGVGDENAVCSARGGRIDELIEEKGGRETQAMDVEDADGGQEEMEKELKDEVSDRIGEYIRNKEVGVIEEENSVNEGYKNEFEEAAEPKDECVEMKYEVPEERFGSGVEDDWEGIERSELDNDFNAAAAFVREGEKYGKLSNIGSEVKMQLYGLQKIVMEGPCREAQPMALKMSARAKWNAWQKLGNMNPEDAMKQYIALVSDINSEWGKQNDVVDDQSENVEGEKLSISDPNQSKPPNESQRKKELTDNADGIESIETGSSSL